MTRKPSQETTSAWARLVRVQQGLLAAVEQDLKNAGFPPLAWYDALLDGMQHLLGWEPIMEGDNIIGLAERKTCPIDGRGQYVVITQGGRNLQKKMWDTYSAAIERHVGAKLSNKDAAQLCDLLGRLA